MIWFVMISSQVYINEILIHSYFTLCKHLGGRVRPEMAIQRVLIVWRPWRDLENRIHVYLIPIFLIILFRLKTFTIQTEFHEATAMAMATANASMNGGK
jgi:hypothetical protein